MDYLSFMYSVFKSSSDTLHSKMNKASDVIPGFVFLLHCVYVFLCLLCVVGAYICLLVYMCDILCLCVYSFTYLSCIGMCCVHVCVCVGICVKTNFDWILIDGRTLKHLIWFYREFSVGQNHLQEKCYYSTIKNLVKQVYCFLYLNTSVIHFHMLVR